MSKNVVVIGAGIVGLSTALRIVEEYDNVNIVVIADTFLNQTTSYGSGGLWEPYQIAGTPDEKINQWGKKAFDHFLSIYHSADCAKAGVQLLQAYQLLKANENVPVPSWSDIVFNFQELDNNDLKKMNLSDKFSKGYTFGTLVIEQKSYLQYVTDILLSTNKVKFIQRKLDSLADIPSTLGSIHIDFNSIDAIVNCTGLGAYTLLNDNSMYPIRGQVIRVKAPWMNTVYFFGSSYIIPNVDSVVLGGTAQKGDWNTTTSLKDTQKILDDIYDVFPSLSQAKIETIWAGLRPGRTPLRLDSESVVIHNKSIKVVHCYGHGGSGITLGYGCADEIVTDHLAPIIRGSNPHSKHRVLSKL